jgi:hypothetical protein
MDLNFNSFERDQLRQAWNILCPRIEQWLVTSAPAQPETQSQMTGIEPVSNRLCWRDFIEPVKQVLKGAPGQRLTVHQLHAAIQQKMSSRMAARDTKVLTSGPVRWKTFVNQVGVELRKIGVLDPDADRGIWQLKQ